MIYTGIAFGPSDLMDGPSFNFGPAPFTGTLEGVSPGNVLAVIAKARQAGVRLLLNLTSGPHKDYLTGGKFDRKKWSARLKPYNTTAIRNGIAAAVADGTVPGYMGVDETEHLSWGGVFTKALLDDMADEVHAIFPTLPFGIQHGPGAYRWLADQRFKKLDFVLYAYKWNVQLRNKYKPGDVAGWRTEVLKQNTLDGTVAVFSLNVLDGGVQDKSGRCPQSHPGTYVPNCWMTPDQIREYGSALIPHAAYFGSWRYDHDFFRVAANVEAFRSLAPLAASQPTRSLKRP